MTPEQIRKTRDDRFQDLCKLAEDLGYKGSFQQLYNNNGSAVSSLINLLEDNPEAVRALIDWCADELGHDEDEEKCEECDEYLEDCACEVSGCFDGTEHYSNCDKG